MIPDNRARMRDALRAAVGRTRLPGAELEHPGRFTPPPDEPYDLVERFSSEFTKLGGVVHEATTADEVAEIVVAAIRTEESRNAESIPSILMWDDRHLPIAGLGDAIRARGVRVLTQSPETAASAEHRQELASATVGITGADGGIAQTGSLVLASGPGRGRLASLLPPVHVALLQRSRMFETLPRFIGAHPDVVTSGANFVCITGPSRTADIEHVLAKGVHGPKEIHVVLV